MATDPPALPSAEPPDDAGNLPDAEGLEPVTLAEAARRLRVSERTLRRWRSTGELADRLPTGWRVTLAGKRPVIWAPVQEDASHLLASLRARIAELEHVEALLTGQLRDAREQIEFLRRQLEAAQEERGELLRRIPPAIPEKTGWWRRFFARRTGE